MHEKLMQNDQETRNRALQWLSAVYISPCLCCVPMTGWVKYIILVCGSSDVISNGAKVLRTPAGLGPEVPHRVPLESCFWSDEH